MSTRRVAGPGRKVSTGHLRVDTARAVQKLREYQLAEPASWVLEVLRAAITLGATRLTVAGDASDISISWEGGLLDDETMRTVLDELVNPGESRRDGAIRRLAIGLNTALGLMPRRVDLERTDADGQRTRVRYTSDLLDPPGPGETLQETGAGLSHLAAERVAPADAGARPGMRVTMRRRTGFDSFRRFLGRAEPDELRLVRECADDVPVPLHIGDDVLDRDDSPNDLLRIPLAAGLEGFVALVDADSTAAGNQPAWVDFAERGVILSRAPLPLPNPWRDPRVSVPIRLFLDRHALPTNASRSAVRMDDSLRTALDVAAERVPRLLEETHRLLLGETSELAQQPGVTRTAPAARHHRLRKSVLHLIAAYVRGKPWRFDEETMPAELQPLMALPLLRDAVGAPASVLDFAESDGMVYRGQVPLSAELYGDSLHKMPFIPPGDAASVLVPDGTYDAERVNKLLEQAAEEVRAKAVFLTGATTTPTVPSTDDDAWVVVPVRAARKDSFLAHEPLPPKDIEGEVALYATSGTPRGRITFLHASRPIEELLMPAPCSYVAVVACPRLIPLPDYRGLGDHDVRREVVRAVERAVLVAAELAAGLLLGNAVDVSGARVLRGAPPASGPTPEHLRALQAAHARAQTRAGERPHCEASPLAQVRCIPVLHPDGEHRMESALDVVARARVTKALLYRVARGRQSPGPFPLAVADADSAAVLAAIAGVPAARLDPSSRSGPWVPHIEADAVLRVRGEGFVGEIGWGDVESVWSLYRDAVELERTALSPNILPATVHIDDARVIVDAATGKVVLRPNLHELLGEWERALLGALIAGARGEPPPELRVRQPTDVARQLCRAMALAPRPFRKHFDREYRHLSDALQLPTARGGSISLATLRAKQTAWALPPGARITFDHPEFQPVVLDSAWSSWVKTVLGRELRDGTEVQHEFARQAGGAAQRERVMSRSPVPAPVLDPTDPFQRGVQRREITGVVRVPSTPPFTIALTVSGRPLCEVPAPLELPFSGQLDMHPSLVDAAWDGLADAGRSALATLLRDELEAVLVAIATDRPSELHSARGEALVKAWAGQRGGRKGDARVREALSHARAWPSIQGPAVSLLEAKRKGRVQAAVFQGTWLEARKGERKVQQDHPVVSATAPIANSALARFAALVDVGPLTDTTHAVQQLQSRRRVEQGESELPRLGRPDAIAIAKLLKDDARLLTSLGLGEARLALDAQGSNPSTAYLHVQGQRVGSQALAVFPPVELAFEASGYLPEGKPASVDKRKLTMLTQRVQRLANRLVQRAFEQGEATTQLRRATRFAWLGQKVIEDALVEELPLLETTSGGWTSLAELRAAEASQGPAWFTTELSSQVVPDEVGRVAIRLTPGEAKTLGTQLALEDATEALAVQAVRIANKNRPKTKSLDARDTLAILSKQPKTALLAYAELEPSAEHTARGSLVVLTPGSSSLLGLFVHHELHPLGAFPCPSDWPALVVVDDPTLTPNVRYDEPKKDARWDALLWQVAAATRAALRKRFDPGDDFSTRHVDLKLPSGTMGVGVIGLGDPLTAGELVVMRHQQELLRDLPLRGEVFVCLGPARGSRGDVGMPETLAIARAAYGELLLDLANALAGVPLVDPELAPSWARDTAGWSADELEFAQAHVVLGALRGSLPPAHAVNDELMLPCFRPLPITLRAARELLAGTRTVYSVEPDGPDAHGADPNLVVDDSLLSRVIAGELGARVRRVRRWRAQPPVQLPDPEPFVAAAHAPTALPMPHPLAKLVEELRELLAATAELGARGPIRVGISSRRREPMLAVDPTVDQVVLAGGNAALRTIAEALAEDDPQRGRRAAMALAAHVLALLDDTAAKGNRPDQLRVLEEWLVPP
ncbi:MAG: hypothetical protein IPH72_20065 [Sandaracinaceae bacterium]|nr:hypothetical protein [Sandaracinaceae bacterium]